MSRIRVLILAVALALMASSFTVAEAKEAPPGSIEALQEIFARRARWLLSDDNPVPLAADYLPDVRTAQWALTHERSKIESVRLWADGRGIRITGAEPSLQTTLIDAGEDRVRFYVAQSLALQYRYGEEPEVNQSGVGSRHIVDLQRVDDRWLIKLEWYSDPLGGDREVPAAAPATERQPVDDPAAPAAWRSYDRQKAVGYADMYCGSAAGCGNNHRYNPRFRDYSGEGGNCANFASQALRAGGLNVWFHAQVGDLVHSLIGSGRAGASFRGKYPAAWKTAVKGGRFPVKLQLGDLVAYQVKGKMEHVAIVTGFDAHGYPLVNSHTIDRYHVPFDLGWDRNTVFWLVKVW